VDTEDRDIEDWEITRKLLQRDRAARKPLYADPADCGYDAESLNEILESLRE